MSAQEGTTSFFGAVMSFFVETAHAEAPPADSADAAPAPEEEEPAGEDKEEGAEEEAAGGAEEEEEEEEPEDPAPAIRQACQDSPQCAPATKHFMHCSEKIEGGKGWHGEDCVEELFHMMHCVDACAAPKLFKKLV